MHVVPGHQSQPQSVRELEPDEGFIGHSVELYDRCREDRQQQEAVVQTLQGHLQGLMLCAVVCWGNGTSTV